MTLTIVCPRCDHAYEVEREAIFAGAWHVACPRCFPSPLAQTRGAILNALHKDGRHMSSIVWRSSATLRLLPAAATMGVLFALSSRRTPPTPPGLAPDLVAIAGHFAAYAILAILMWWGLPPSRLAKRQRVAAAFSCAVVFGASDEWHQSFVPGRDSSLVDLAVDAVGAACGLGILGWIAASASRQPGVRL